MLAPVDPAARAKTRGRRPRGARTAFLPFALLAACAPQTEDGSARLSFEQEVVADTEGNRWVGDFNGDARNDIAIVDTGSDELVTYAHPDWTRITRKRFDPIRGYKTYRADNLAGADIDGDGDTDLVGRIGKPEPKDNHIGSIVWWEQESPVSWSQHTVSASPAYVKDLFAADLDDDGRPDIVTRDGTHLRFYRQEGPETWSDQGSIRISDKGEGLNIGDIDADGDLDLVVPRAWYENPGRMDRAWARHVVDPDFDEQANVGVGDVDGDGRLDIAYAASEDNGLPAAWYSAQDPSAAWRKHIVVPSCDHCQNMQIADFDQDGDGDIVTGSFPHRSIEPPYEVAVYVNQDGAGTTWRKLKLTDEGQYHLIVADVGSDGDLDIVGPRSHNRAPIWLWENQLVDDASPGGGGAEACPDARAVRDAASATGGKGLAIDGDDGNDRNGDAVWPLAEQPGSLDDWSHHKIDTSRSQRFFGIDAGDLNHDGRLDLVSGHYAYLNAGDVREPWPRYDLPKDHDTIAITDVDGDDLADVIAIHPHRYGTKGTSGDVSWLEALDCAATEWRVVERVAHVDRVDHAIGTQGYRAAQIFPGGKDEAVYSLDDTIRVLKSPERPRSAAWIEIDVAEGKLSALSYGDFDDDGLVDIVGNLDRNDLYWYQNPGAATDDWERVKIADLPRYSPDQIRTGDLDGDGDVDVVVVQEVSSRSDGPHEARAIWYENPGGAARAAWRAHEFARQHSTNALDLADMDGDGDLDPVTGEHRGPQRLIIWENDGRGNLAPHEVDRGVDHHAGARAWDVDQDGDLDLVSISWSGHQDMHLWINGAR